MGAPRDIREIRVFQGKPNGTDEMTYVNVSVDGVNSWHSSIEHRTLLVIELSDVVGQKTRIDRQSQFRLRINEVEIYGRR